MLRSSTKCCALLLCASAAALIAASPALAQSAPVSQGQAEGAVGNLLQGLVNKKVLSRKDAQDMMDKFHADLGKNAPAAQSAPAAMPPVEPGTVAVPYISDTVKDEITNRVQEGVIKKAKDERWATPGTFPEWVGRIHIFGDFRFRDEGRYFNKNNSTEFLDTATMNSGSAYDIATASSGYKGLPFLNSTQDRNLLRIRARVGIEAQLDDAWTLAVRLASGNDTSPVSTNQTLGSDFGKKSLWLDQAYGKYEPLPGDAVLFGRMPMPFERTELIWSENVNPDGLAFKGGYDVFGKKLNLHAVAAAFALDNASDNANANQSSDKKVGLSANRWLFAGQLGASYSLDRLKLGLDAAYYNYSGVRSTLSSTCTNTEAAVYGCDSDATRPTFMQKGNTLFLLRAISDPNTTYADPQYFGLASKFEVLDFIAKADFAATDKIHVTLTGDYARNLAYSAKAIQALPIVNNNETCSVTVTSGSTCAKSGGTNLFKDGNQAWLLRLAVGAPKIVQRWDWNTSLTYAYIEPDAVLDAFTDSDFHLGGTNAKGWTIAGNLGVAHNTWLTAKWISTDAVWGPAFSVDVLQLDVNMRF